MTGQERTLRENRPCGGHQNLRIIFRVHREGSLAEEWQCLTSFFFLPLCTVCKHMCMHVPYVYRCTSTLTHSNMYTHTHTNTCALIPEPFIQYEWYVQRRDQDWGFHSVEHLYSTSKASDSIPSPGEEAALAQTPLRREDIHTDTQGESSPVLC